MLESSLWRSLNPSDRVIDLEPCRLVARDPRARVHMAKHRMTNRSAACIRVLLQEREASFGILGAAGDRRGIRQSRTTYRATSLQSPKKLLVPVVPLLPSPFGQEGDFQKISDGDFHMTPDIGKCPSARSCGEGRNVQSWYTRGEVAEGLRQRESGQGRGSYGRDARSSSSR
jgi:hypothetical protein